MGRGLISIGFCFFLIGCGDARWQTPSEVEAVESSQSSHFLVATAYNLRFFGTGGGFIDRELNFVAKE